MSQPLISIVIANYNYGRFLETAIQSVLSQGMGDQVELIICDAASTDNSVEIIKTYADKLAWWCSESDGGQSAAFNKGFAHARGKYLTWLNADDLLLPGTIAALRKADRRHPNQPWFTGNVVRFDDSTGKIVSAPWGGHWLPGCLQGRHFPLQIFGPTVFLQRGVYHELGPIDESMHYVMDTEYWWRLTAKGYKHRRINHDCWAFRFHNESKTAIFSMKGDEVEAKAKRVSQIGDSEVEILQARYQIKPWRICWLLITMLKIVDFSLVLGLYRRLFVVGRQIENCYENK